MLAKLEIELGVSIAPDLAAELAMSVKNLETTFWRSSLSVVSGPMEKLYHREVRIRNKATILRH
jgi:hypothetical protein